MSRTTELVLPDETATARLGRALAAGLAAQLSTIEQAGFNFRLEGDLGAGKTALIRALLRGLNVSGPIKSPSFALVEAYKISSLDFYHFDFYRFADPAEFASAGFRENFGPGNITAVEWPNRAGPRLPAADLEIELDVAGDGRVARLFARTPTGQACLSEALKSWESPAAA